MFDNVERCADYNRKNMCDYTTNHNPVIENSSNFWSPKHTYTQTKKGKKEQLNDWT